MEGTQLFAEYQTLGEAVKGWWQFREKYEWRLNLTLQQGVISYDIKGRFYSLAMKFSK